MKNRIYLVALASFMGACSVSPRKALNAGVKAFWHQSAEKVAPPELTPSLMPSAAGRTWHAQATRSAMHPHIVAVSYRAPVAMPATAPLAVLATVRSPELSRADSLLSTLQAQNRTADTATRVEAQHRAAAKQAQRTRRASREGFDFRATNIKAFDTVFVDKPGVRLAFWLEGDEVRMKVAKGVLTKGRTGEALDVEVKPGFDWQPYRAALLIIGASVAALIVLSLSFSIFTHAHQKQGALNRLA